MVNSIKGACTAAMMEKARKACVPANINVYNKAEPTTNENKIVKTILDGTWSAFKDTLGAKVNMVQFTFGTLIDASSGNAITKLNEDNYRFQTQVNAALDQMKGCIDEKILENDVKDALTELQTAQKNFEDLDQWSGNSEFDDKYYDAWNKYHDLINNNLDTSKANWKRASIKQYIANLPVFVEAALNYRVITLGYLGYLDQNNLDKTYHTVLRLAKEDATTLTNWIVTARSEKANGLLLQEGTWSNEDYWDRRHIVGSYESRVCWNSCPLVPYSIQWFIIMSGTPKYHSSNSVHWDMKLKPLNRDGQTHIQCQMDAYDCAADYHSCFWCASSYTVSYSCQTKIYDIVQATMREYRTSVKEEMDEFEDYYYTFTNTLNDYLKQLN